MAGVGGAGTTGSGLTATARPAPGTWSFPARAQCAASRCCRAASHSGGGEYLLTPAVCASGSRAPFSWPPGSPLPAPCSVPLLLPRGATAGPGASPARAALDVLRAVEVGLWSEVVTGNPRRARPQPAGRARDALRCRGRRPSRGGCSSPGGVVFTEGASPRRRFRATPPPPPRLCPTCGSVCCPGLLGGLCRSTWFQAPSRRRGAGGSGRGRSWTCVPAISGQSLSPGPRVLEESLWSSRGRVGGARRLLGSR